MDLEMAAARAIMQRQEVHPDDAEGESGACTAMHDC